MRQTTMAAVALLMSRGRCHQADLATMTVPAEFGVLRRSHEAVRPVTLRALRAGMKLRIGACRLVTARAFSGADGGPSRRRMGIVTADAGAGHASFWMVRVLVPMAVRASAIGRSGDVVCAVTTRAVRVGWNTRPEHHDVFVTGAARDRAGLREFVRAMAADAFGVPMSKQRSGRDHGFLAGVTARARRTRILGGCVLLLVAGGARFGQGLAVDGVCRLHVVAVRASGGRGLLVLVGAVAGYALVGMVNLDRGSVALLL
jgi:hypothetical protein